MAEPTPSNASSFEHLRLFHDAARALTSSLDLPTILRSILEQMERFFHPESWSLLMVDDEKRDLYYALARGVSDEALQNIRIPFGTGMAGWVALHGEPLIATTEGVAERLSSGEQPHSAICLPLRSRERTLGVLQVTHVEPQTLNDDAITFLYIVCDYAAIAIENARAVERIQELTITDDCTGLYNVRYLYRQLEAQIERASRFPSAFSLIFIDLDHFKLVNDRYGHLVGSQLLADVGQVLKAHVRGVDSVFRYGGDEFTVLLPESNKSAAQETAARLHRALREKMFMAEGGLALNVRASFGVATFPEDGNSLHEIIRSADTMMYLVKGLTRDNVAVAGLGVLPAI